jgi:polysaccharide pyruvyl transferase WcaK-like protein
MRISIVGWYGKKNVGDECFRHVLSDFFSGHEIEFVTPPSICSKPDVVILGGGAVASPFYLNNLPLDVPRYAIGIDMAYESEIDLLEKAQFKEIIVRNHTDLNSMRNKLSCPTHWFPDLAFYLKQEGDIVDHFKRHKQKKTLGVFATDYINPAIDRPVSKFADRAWSFKIKLAAKLDQLSEGYEIMLIPCSTGGYGDDRRINLDLAAFMKNEPTNVMETLNPQEMINLTGGLDAAICMRFHAHIFCMITQTPFVSIGLTRKVNLFLKEHKLTNLVAGTLQENEFCFDGLEDKMPSSIDFDSTNYKQRLLELRQITRKDWLGECL